MSSGCLKCGYPYVNEIGKHLERSKKGVEIVDDFVGQTAGGVASVAGSRGWLLSSSPKCIQKQKVALMECSFYCRERRGWKELRVAFEVEGWG